MNKSTLCYLLLSVGIIAVSCRKEPSENSNKTKQIGNVIINNNSAELNNRVKLRDEILDVEPVDEITSQRKSVKEPPKIDPTKNYVFKLKAEVDAPIYNGDTLQATHVKILDNYAFVTYNTRGDKILGGLDVFDVSDLKNPKIVWHAVFPNVDVSSVDYYNNKLYIVGAYNLDAEPIALNRPAMLEVLSLDASREISKVDTIIDLNSYAGTDVRVTENNVYATSGSDGYLKIFDHSYNLLNSISLDHARAIDANSQHIYVLQGEPGRVNVYNRSDASYVTTYNIGGAMQPEAKSELAISEKYIFAALNEGGMQMLNADGSLKQLIPKPVTPEGGDDNNFVTNSVSLNGDLVLLANGEAGLYIGGLIEQQHDSITMIGKIRFGAGQSANFVESVDSVIFVATGRGGLKILALSVDDGVPGGVTPSKPCPTLYNRILELFPEGKNNMGIYPDLFSSSTLKTIKLKNESEVYVTFVAEGAGWKNSFGYYTYNEANPPATVDDLDKHILFPNVSGVGEGGGLDTGDMVQVGSGKFPAGTVIGFYIVAKGWQNGKMVAGRYTEYTDTRFNIGGHQQHVMFIEQTCGDLVLAFEDIDQSDHLSYQDNDFNDILFTVKDNKVPNQANVNFVTDGIPVK